MIQNMMVPILIFTFLTVVSGLLHTSHDGTLQCQCTCTPVGNPNKNIYTSGNLNIIDKKTSTNNEQLEEIITMDKEETKPQIAPVKLPDDKPITQYNDIAVSKIKHSLGLGVHRPIYETIKPKEVVKPEIKWSHTASSSSSSVTKDAVKDVTSSLMKHKDIPTSEVLVNKPTIEKISNTQDGQKTVIDQVKSTTDKVLSRANSNQNTAVNQNIQQRFISSSQDADKVAADIGFVMDGSSLNPILSGGLSGGMGYSSGTGYIVETINKNSPENQAAGKFVQRNSNVQNGQVVSGVLNPSNSKPDKVNTVGGIVKTTSHSTAEKAEIATNEQRKTNDQTKFKSRRQINNDNKTLPPIQAKKPQIDNNNNNQKLPTIQGKKPQMNNNNNNQELPNNQSQQPLISNNSNNNKNQQIPNNQFKHKSTNVWNTLNNNVKNNNKQPVVNNEQISKTRWPNNNQQTDGNRWSRQQMKPFQIQRDLKHGVLSNNNNQWGNSNNWGTTQDPFGTMNMDPLLFLGQHQFK
ncbi:rho GTPase-activating protein gacZ-like [Mytilus trossulus]|uniref:rho GTPase-activating protein gacZ-like n=1 Tax=Mytilus trossulus TaxID=6551 RepID=UPI003006E08E